MNTRIRLPLLLLLVVGIAPFAMPADAASQVVTLDEGSFRIEIDGAERGTESFTIRRNGIGSDASVILAVEVTRGDGGVQMRPMLEANAALEPQRYENQISGGRRADVSLVRSGRRFLATVVSERGEAAQEFRAGAGTMILEPRVASLYWFLSPMLSEVGREVYGIEPETGARPVLRLEGVAPGTLRIGRTEHDVRIARLVAADDVRRIWFDDQGRVLRVEIPAQSFVAERLPEG